MLSSINVAPVRMMRVLKLHSGRRQVLSNTVGREWGRMTWYPRTLWRTVWQFLFGEEAVAEMVSEHIRQPFKRSRERVASVVPERSSAATPCLSQFPNPPQHSVSGNYIVYPRDTHAYTHTHTHT